MSRIHDIATLTSNAQSTLPKSIRQAFGVDTGSKVALDLRDGEIVAVRANARHEDRAIYTLLGQLEADVQAGRHVQPLPDDLARAMLAMAGHAVNLDQDIEGEVDW